MAKTFHFKLTHPERMMTLAGTYSKKSEQIQDGPFIWMGIEGNYHLYEDSIDLDITRKPPVISWAIIESNLKKFFQQLHLI